MRRSEIPDIKNMTLVEILVVAVKKHGSIDLMENFKQDSKKEDKKLINKHRIIKYVNSLGYYENIKETPEVPSTYIIGDFENDTYVKRYLEKLKDEVNLILLIQPLNFQKLKMKVTPVKLKELLNNIDSSLEKRNDEWYDRVIKILKEKGFNAAKSQLNIKLSIEQNVKSFEEERKRMEETKQILRNLGYDVEEKMILEYGYNTSKITKFIDSSSFDFIRSHTVSWEAFLNKI